MIFKAENPKEFSGEIANIEKHCFPTPWTKEQICASGDTTVFFLAKCEEKIIGYGGLYTVLDEGYVTNIGVLPEFRRKGIGRRLTEKLLEYSKDKDLQFLSLEVRLSNGAAISLYKDLGFEEVGKRKNFYSNPTEDALIMTRYFK